MTAPMLSPPLVPFAVFHRATSAAVGPGWNERGARDAACLMLAGGVAGARSCGCSSIARAVFSSGMQALFGHPQPATHAATVSLNQWLNCRQAEAGALAQVAVGQPADGNAGRYPSCCAPLRVARAASEVRSDDPAGRRHYLPRKPLQPCLEVARQPRLLRGSYAASRVCPRPSRRCSDGGWPRSVRYPRLN